jgi:hypothetical protein
MCDEDDDDDLIPTSPRPNPHSAAVLSPSDERDSPMDDAEPFSSPFESFSPSSSPALSSPSSNPAAVPLPSPSSDDDVDMGSWDEDEALSTRELVDEEGFLEVTHTTS